MAWPHAEPQAHDSMGLPDHIALSRFCCSDSIAKSLMNSGNSFVRSRLRPIEFNLFKRLPWTGDQPGVYCWFGKVMATWVTVRCNDISILVENHTDSAFHTKSVTSIT
jgi:hypothetical protein